MGSNKTGKIGSATGSLLGGKTVSIYVTKEERDLLKAEAEKRNMTFNYFMLQILENGTVDKDLVIGENNYKTSNREGMIVAYGVRTETLTAWRQEALNKGVRANSIVVALIRRWIMTGGGTKPLLKKEI